MLAMKRILMFSLAVAIVVATSTGCISIPSTRSPALQSEIQKKIEDIRGENISMQRERKSQELADIVHRDPHAVSQVDINSISGLLEDVNYRVRIYAAISLGIIGPKAKSATPALQKALKEVECERGDFSLADVIRPALMALGNPPPAPPSCESSGA